MVHSVADHGRPRRALALAALLAGCSGPPAMEATSRATLDLSSAWNAQPWRTSGAKSVGLRLSGRVDLPAGRLGAGSALVLEGAWWGVQATVNGVALPATTGGLAPVHLDVGPHLKVGENTFVLAISPPPEDVPALLTGGGLESGRVWRPDRADLQVAPRLELRPAAHVDTVSLPLDAGQVRATARVSGAPEGARVRFTVSLDGEQLTSLGEAPVVGGVATAPATAWSLDDWRPGRPALYLAQAELLGPDGAVIDRLARRTGALDVAGDGGGLRIAGEPQRLMGVRVTNRDRDLPKRFREAAASGVNSVEVHGELPRTTWLDQADELGLPTVIVPRCVGRANKGDATDAILAAQYAQDVRLVDHTAHHPSPVLWATEGRTANSQKKSPDPPKVLWTEGLLTDPLDRPVSQHDVKSRVQRVGMPGPDGAPQDSCTEEGCVGAWLTEVTWRGPVTPEKWTVMTARTQHALTEGGAMGVVIPPPRRVDPPGWAPAWAAVAAAAGVVPAASGPFRAASLVALQRGPPGASVFVEAPGHPTVGTVLDARGAGQLRLWHEGPAEVVLDGRRLPVTLRAGTWESWVESPSSVAVDLSGS